MSFNISRRHFGLLVGSIAAGAVLAGCSGSGGGGEGSVTWSTWGSPDELKGFDAFQDAFKAAHPDIDLTFQPTPSYGDYHSKLMTQLTSNTAPDVFYVGDDRVASIIRNDVLLPIGDNLQGISESDFATNVLDIGRWEGNLYALPNDVNPDTLWYDKETLAAAGITDDPAELAERDEWTTEAFLDMSDKLAAAGLTTAVFWNYWATHYSWITSQDGQAYDADGNFVAHTDETSVAAMEEFAARFQSGEFKLADLLPAGAGADSMLVTHKLGFYAAGRYTIGTIRGAGVDEASYDIVRWPTPDGAARPTGVAASYLVVNKSAEDESAALTFFSEFLNAEGQRLRLEGAGNAVPSINGADDIVLSGDYPAHAQTMLDMRDIGYSNFATEAAVPDLSNQISVEHMQPLYEGKSDARATLEAVAALVAEKTA